MITAHDAPRSDEAFLQSLRNFSDAGGSIIQIRTREPMRAATILRKHMVSDNAPYMEWTHLVGFRTFTAENTHDFLARGDGKDFYSAMEYPLTQMRDPTSVVSARTDAVHFFCYVDPESQMAGNPVILDMLRHYEVICPTRNVCIIFITDDKPMDCLPAGMVLSTHLPTPTAQELAEVATRLVESAPSNPFPGGIDVSEEDILRVAHMGLGLTFTEFETAMALSVVEAGNVQVDDGDQRTLTVDDLLAGVSRSKTEVIRQSEILELMEPVDLSSVGGMNRLKDWVEKRKDCYSDEAREAGIRPPKGAVLVGVPGTGKSLVAKAIAATLAIPLVRLDFGRVFSKFIGDSEQRVRSALAMVTAMAPCVLFVDEIDKGLGGIGSGGDSGTSMRVLGTYLTWLQELKAPVFNMVTANRVHGLPPELLRRGRFDQIFSVGLPSAKEREEVLGIHLRIRGYDISQFSAREIASFVERTDRFVPAEIESVVQDALVEAFSEGEALGMKHLLHAVGETVCMAVSNAEQIQSIVDWAAANARPVNYGPGESAAIAGTTAPVAATAAPRIFRNNRARKV